MYLAPFQIYIRCMKMVSIKTVSEEYLPIWELQTQMLIAAPLYFTDSSAWG